MEKMTDVQDWMKNNINGQVAAKLIEIGERKGEDVYMADDFEHSLKYQGREMNLGLEVVGSKVGDIPDESDYVYTAYLGDLAVCHDFYEAIGELQKEKGFSLEISDYISFNDCVLALGGEYEIIKKVIKIIEESGLKDKKTRDEILAKICNDLNGILSQYSVIIKYGRLYLDTTNPILKQDIINKNESFLNDMNIIKGYFDNNLTEIETKIKKAKYEEIIETENLKKEQEDRLNSLQNQL